MEKTIRSVARLEAIMEKKCEDQQGLIRSVVADLKEAKEEARILRVSNKELSYALSNAKADLNNAQERQVVLTDEYVSALKYERTLRILFNRLSICIKLTISEKNV
ncbi:hypothetical protein ACLB2K_022473 [Fragaria x ananassa]